MKKDLNISLWEKESGNALSHAGGLTQDQITALEELLQRAKDGENVRFILFKNNKRDRDTSPTHNLRLYRGNAGSSSDGGL